VGSAVSSGAKIEPSQMTVTHSEPPESLGKQAIEADYYLGKVRPRNED